MNGVGAVPKMSACMFRLVLNITGLIHEMQAEQMLIKLFLHKLKIIAKCANVTK